MRLYELERPGNRGDAVKLLLQAGYQMLGHPGTHGIVLRKPGAAYCVKLFSTRDTAYLDYLRLIQSQTNPHFPRVIGKLVGIKEPPMRDTDGPQAMLAMLRQMDVFDPGERTEGGVIIFYAIRLEVLEANDDEGYRWAVAIDAFLHGKNRKLATSEPTLVAALRSIERLRHQRDYKANNILFRGTVPVLIDPIV